MKDKFERYAAGYTAGMEHPLKRLVGGSAEEFVAVKVRWLVRDLEQHPLGGERDPTRPQRILDDGCGAGAFLQLLRRPAGPVNCTAAIRPRGCWTRRADVGTGRRRPSWT